MHTATDGLPGPMRLVMGEESSAVCFFLGGDGMLRVFLGMVTAFFFSYSVFALPIIELPESEQVIIAEVADQYELEGDARLLLYIIRKIENGRSGYAEFGVLHPRAIGRGFRVQAEWAAGTIKKRFTGDLVAFAARWCPVGATNDPTGMNVHWYKNAAFYMQKWGSVKQ